MNKNLRAPLIVLAIVVVCGAFLAHSSDDFYKGIMVGMDGVQTENDSFGHECWAFPNKDIICLEVWETWAGFRDARPVTLNGHRL
jgi:hypothetical protein